MTNSHFSCYSAVVYSREYFGDRSSHMYLVEQKAIEQKSPEIIIVGGGKGGVGKTCLSANLAVEISRKGWRVVVVDADLGCSNLEIVLGVNLEHRLDDFFQQDGAKTLAPFVCETQYENLSVVPGSSGAITIANPKYQQKLALIREMKKIDADVIIVDLDAGTHLNTLDFFLMAETSGILVITPEKTSIDNAFKFLRSCLFRKIERFYRSPEVSQLLHKSQSLTGFIERVEQAAIFEPELRKQLAYELNGIARSVRPRIVVNRARNSYEAEIAGNLLAKNARQYLRIDPIRLGYILFDKIVPETVNSGVPYIVSHPRLKISGCITNIASHLGYV